MDFRRLTKAQVKKAFSLVKSLAYDVTFRKDVPVGFDFNSQTATTGPVSTVTLSGIPAGNETRQRDTVLQNAEVQKLLFIAEGFPDLKLYSSAQFNDLDWKISGPQSNDGYVVTVTFVRERNG
jgi:hypothetical protein